MTKKLIFLATVAIASVSAFYGLKTQKTDSISELTLLNINALSRTETTGNCDLWCSDQYGSVCTLMTNYGFPIRCWNMKESFYQ